MLGIRSFHLRSLRISLRNFAVLCGLWSSMMFVVSPCRSGQEFECKTVRGDGKTCVTGCNLTIASSISKGNCTEGCCKFCYTDCIECFYTKIITFCVLNYNKNTSLTQQMFHRQSYFFKSLHNDIQTSIHALVQNKSQSLTSFEIVILSINWCSVMHNSLKINFKIVTKTVHRLNLILSEMSNASRDGKLGKLNLVNNVFEVIDEDEYKESKFSQEKKREDKLDVVELAVTCVAALIVILAIVWCLFYLCTTPAARAQCYCFKTCKSNRTAHASN